MLLTILVILLLFAFLGGGLGYSRYGYYGFSPTLLLAVLIILALLYHW